MGQHDAGDVQTLDGDVHRLFGGEIEVAGGLVQQQDLRALVQRPRQQHALALAANRVQCRTRTPPSSAQPIHGWPPERCGETSAPTTTAVILSTTTSVAVGEN